GNDVALKWGASHACGLVPGIRIINRLGRHTQIAHPLSRGRHSQAIIVRAVVLNAQIITKKECPVLDNGPANCASEVVVGKVPSGAIEKITRRKRTDSIELVCRAV